jgi:hypothetical protein
VVIGRPRLIELATLTDEARNTIFFYLTLSTFSSPVTETPLWTIKGWVIRLGET